MSDPDATDEILNGPQDGVHPFARAMADFLLESGNRTRRPSIIVPFMRSANAKYKQDTDLLMGYVDGSTFIRFDCSTVRGIPDADLG